MATATDPVLAVGRKLTLEVMLKATGGPAERVYAHESLMMVEGLLRSPKDWTYHVKRQAPSLFLPAMALNKNTSNATERWSVRVSCSLMDSHWSHKTFSATFLR